MQYATDRIAVGAFNAAAPALESTVINGIAYEVFHDYYHKRPMPYRHGLDEYKSVGFRIAGQPDSFNFHSRGFFKRKCKAMVALQVWIDAMQSKYAGWEVR